MEIALAVIAIILQVGAPYLQELHNKVGNEYKSKITNLAKKIYSKIGNNQLALDKLATAYNQRNSNLANAVFTQAGFGPAVKALNREIKEAEAKYKEEQGKMTKENTELTNQYNELVNAGTQTGTITGNKYARQTYNQVGQAVQGGLEDYKHEDILDKNTELVGKAFGALDNAINKGGNK